MAQILKIDELESRLQMTRGAIYKLIKEGTFPAPVQLLKRASGWIESEVDEWVMSRPRGVRTFGTPDRKTKEEAATT